MSEILIDMGISAVLALLTRYIPNDPAQKSKWKKAMLKLFKGIVVVYGNDPEFKDVLK